MSKMQHLQNALNTTTGKSAKASSPKPETPTLSAAPRQPSRLGQVNVSAWLDADFKSSLRLVQARKGSNATLQELLAEALNDLFAKYDVPSIRAD